MRNRKKVMRRVWIGLGVIFGLGVVGVGGMFFVFGEDTMEVLDFRSQESGVRSQDDLGSGDVVLDSEGNVVGIGSSFSSGGGSSGGSSGGESTPGFVCSEWSQLQYSIGNFYENIECLVYGVGGCERVKAVCGGDVMNLDNQAGGVFAIRHSVVAGDEELEEYETSGTEFAYKIIEEDIAAGGRVSLRAEMVIDGEFNVGSLRCVVDMDSVPQKCVN